jgi:hypothetical protein
VDYRYALLALGVVAVVVIVVILRQRGTRQKVEVTGSLLGARAQVRTSVQAEMEGIKAGRDVKALAGSDDPARMSSVEAGRDVIRDTTRHDPKG